MKRLLTFWQDTRHLRILFFLLIVGGVGFLVIRSLLIPDSFGEQGPFRSVALAELATPPSVIQADSVCLECHQDIGDEREDALHVSVSCIHCHGLAREHVAQARKAVDSPDVTIPPAQEWDGDFMTTIDLYNAKDRKACLVCHETVIGMPEDFAQITVAAHLEENEAEDRERPDVCYDCHGPHDTAP